MADKDPLAESRRRIEKETAEQLARAENSQPTPTQEENDRAKLGVDSLAQLDDKEPDGSEGSKDASASGSASYQTRVSSAKK